MAACFFHVSHYHVCNLLSSLLSPSPPLQPLSSFPPFSSHHFQILQTLSSSPPIKTPLLDQFFVKQLKDRRSKDDVSLDLIEKALREVIGEGGYRAVAILVASLTASRGFAVRRVALLSNSREHRAKSEKFGLMDGFRKTKIQLSTGPVSLQEEEEEEKEEKDACEWRYPCPSKPMSYDITMQGLFRQY